MGKECPQRWDRLQRDGIQRQHPGREKMRKAQWLVNGLENMGTRYVKVKEG